MTDDEAGEKVHSLAEQLEQAGEQNRAQDIRNALIAGATGGEIVMELRFRILEFLAFPGNASSDTIDIGRELYHYLNQKLQ